MYVVPFTRHLAEWHDLETGGKGRSRSLKMASFYRSYILSIGRPL